MSGPTDDHGRPLTAWGILALLDLEERTELGHCCERINCTSIARQLVSWPGQLPRALCDHHYGWTLHVAGAMGIEEIVRLGVRPLDVVRRLPEPEDLTAARFAAMELT